MCVQIVAISKLNTILTIKKILRTLLRNVQSQQGGKMIPSKEELNRKMDKYLEKIKNKKIVQILTFEDQESGDEYEVDMLDFINFVEARSTVSTGENKNEK